jgi:hypothetical protein
MAIYDIEVPLMYVDTANTLLTILVSLLVGYVVFSTSSSAKTMADDIANTPLYFIIGFLFHELLVKHIIQFKEIELV